MNRLCVLVRKLYGHSFVRFAAVGGVATAVNYGTYVILIHNFDNLYPAIAYVLAFCVSISCNFVLSSYFTFGVKPTRARAVKFLTAHLINFQRVGAARDMALGRGAEALCPAVCLCGRFPGQLLYGTIRFARKVTRSC